MIRQLVPIGTKLSPIVMGYLPVGISFAVIAADAGLSNVEIISMSLLVLGAASQIAAIPLIESGDGLAYIFLVTFLINLRHVALSASLAPNLRRFNSLETALFSYGLTDESYTIHALDVESKSFRKASAIAVNVGTHAVWVISTAIGCGVGVLVIRHMAYVRIDFALVAMFACIVAMFVKLNARTEHGFQWRKFVRLLSIGAISALSTVVLQNYGFKGLAIFLPATVFGVYVVCAAKMRRAMAAEVS